MDNVCSWCGKHWRDFELTHADPKGVQGYGCISDCYDLALDMGWDWRGEKPTESRTGFCPECLGPCFILTLTDVGIREV